MGLCAVLLDIGGVLDHTPPTGCVGAWEGRSGLEPGGLYGRISTLLDAGEVGDATYEQTFSMPMMAAPGWDGARVLRTVAVRQW